MDISYLTHGSGCVRLRSNSASSAELVSCVGAGSPVAEILHVFFTVHDAFCHRDY